MSVNQSLPKLTEQHFMLQEIKETPSALRSLITQNSDGFKHALELVAQSSRVITIGSGSAGLAAASIATSLRQYAGIEASTVLGAEADLVLPFIDSRTTLIAPSQSGETADVLEVLLAAQQKGARIITFVNMPGSTMTRLADASYMAYAGVEQCVMSTKVFSSQVAWGYVLAEAIHNNAEEACHNVMVLADQLTLLLSDPSFLEDIKNLAKEFLDEKDIFILGTGELLPIAQEGMVKLIEGTYKHAHALPAGDLKHYAITLIEEGTPVLFLDTMGSSKQAVIRAAHEVKARGARTIGIGPQSSTLFDRYVETANCHKLQSIASAVVLQLLSYHTTVLLGLPVDKPRNIAKSVTVM